MVSVVRTRQPRACHSALLSIVNSTNLVYTAILYFENNDFILKIIQYNWVYNIVGNLFLKI